MAGAPAWLSIDLGGTVSAPRRGGFWMTNHVANPMLRPLLRGPLGRRWGRRLAVLRYRGRRTGTTYELVVQYVRDGDRVWIMPGLAERKRWWRNMREPLPVELWLAGQHVQGAARAITNEQAPNEVADAFAAYVKGFPRSGNGARPEVMVRVDLVRT
jgi:hypothetical protein